MTDSLVMICSTAQHSGLAFTFDLLLPTIATSTTTSRSTSSSPSCCVRQPCPVVVLHVLLCVGTEALLGWAVI
jgi:hypothetical protein